MMRKTVLMKLTVSQSRRISANTIAKQVTSSVGQ